MRISSPHSHDAPAVRPRAGLSEVLADVARARPELSPESDHHRAAVLLLLIDGTGLNVDRLASRSGFPREFVARCLRRLVDNGWRVESAGRSDSGPGAALQEHFWWDVDVALGRRLRRVTEEGDPEWAPLDRWVKEFEYAGRSSENPGVHNEYRHIPPHNPDPAPPSAGAEEEDDAPPTRRASVPEPADRPARRHAAAPRRPEAPQHVARRHTSTSAAEKLDEALVDGWKEAEWLR